MPGARGQHRADQARGRSPAGAPRRDGEGQDFRLVHPRRARMKPPAASRKPKVPGIASKSANRAPIPALARREGGGMDGGQAAACAAPTRITPGAGRRRCAAPPAARHRAAGPAQAADHPRGGAARRVGRRHTRLRVLQRDGIRAGQAQAARPASAASPSTATGSAGTGRSSSGRPPPCRRSPGTRGRPGGYPGDPARPARTAAPTARSPPRPSRRRSGARRRGPALGQRKAPRSPVKLPGPTVTAMASRPPPCSARSVCDHAGQAGCRPRGGRGHDGGRGSDRPRTRAAEHGPSAASNASSRIQSRTQASSNVSRGDRGSSPAPSP